MENSNLAKYIALQAATAALTAACLLFPNALFLFAALSAQIGMYAVSASRKPFLPSLLSPALSFAAAYLMTGSFLPALLSLVYFPAGLAAAFCIRKCFSRSRTVCFTSLTLGAEMFLCSLYFLALKGITTISGVSDLVVGQFKSLADALVGSMPETYFTQGISEETFRRLLYDYLRLSSFGAIALSCNAAAYFSTALSRMIAVKLKNISLFRNDPQWLYVLSKPSAVVFIICCFCDLIGGETLSLPQRIAFITPVTALLGGVLVMAARVLKERMRVGGLSGLIIFLVVFFLFGLRPLLIMLSVIGLITALKYKSTEDKICKK